MQRDSARNRAFVIIMVFVFAVLGRIAYWSVLERPCNTANGNDEVFYYQTAKSIISSGSYEWNGKLTACKSPGYSLFAAGILALFHHEYAVYLFQFLLGTLSAIPLYLLLRRSFSFRFSVIAITAYLFYPPAWHWESEFLSEAPYIFCANWFIYFVFQYRTQLTMRPLILSALSAAIALLFRSAFAMHLMIVFPFLIWQKRLSRVVAASLVWGIVFVSCLSPWMIRNWRVFHAVIPTSTSGGVSLYGGFVGEGKENLTVAQVLLPEDTEALKHIPDEYSRDRYLGRRGMEHLKQHPWLLVTTMPVKLRDYLHPFFGRWYPFPMGSKYHLPYGLLFWLAFAGLVRVFRENHLSVTIAALYMLGGLLQAAIFHGEIRYGFALNPMMFLTAAFWFRAPYSARWRLLTAIMIGLNLGLWVGGIWIP